MASRTDDDGASDQHTPAEPEPMGRGGGSGMGTPPTINPSVEGTPGNPVDHLKPGPTFGLPEVRRRRDGAFWMEVQLDLRAVIVIVFAMLVVLVWSAYDPKVRKVVREVGDRVLPERVEPTEK